MGLDLNEAVPKWEIVQTSRGRSAEAATIDGVVFHHGHQPEITTGEREIARLVVLAGAAITFLDDGNPICRSRGQSDVKMATAGNLIGVVVFTERRAVAALVRGDFFDNDLNIDRDGVGVLFEFPYEQVASIELEMKNKVFGGTKPVGMWIHARNPYGAGIRLDVAGQTTLEGRGSNVNDLDAVFRRIADAVADHSLPHVYPEARSWIEDYLAEGPQISDEGNPIALFESEDESDPMPLVSLSPPTRSDHVVPTLPDSSEPVQDPVDPSISKTTQVPAAPTEIDTAPALGTTEAPVPLKVAKFCATCGVRFEDNAAFCAKCGSPRPGKPVDG